MSNEFNDSNNRKEKMKRANDKILQNQNEL